MEEQVQVAINNSFAVYSVDFVAGLLGGWAGLIIGHPFDTIKVRQQTHWQGCKTLVQCVRTTIKMDGMTGFYRGMAFPLLSVGFLNSLFFGIYGNSLRLLGKPETGNDGKSSGDYPYSAVLLAGAVAGGLQAIPASPIELIKIRLQSSTDKSLVDRCVLQKSPATATTAASIKPITSSVYQGPMQCLHDVFQQGGIRGVFRGTTITVLREVPGFGAYVLIYEWCTRNLRKDGQKTGNVYAMLFAGGFAGTTSWFVNIPIDIIKSRLQSDDPANPRYTGMRDCARQLYRTEGVRAFWRGLPAVCIRSFPCNAVTFAIYTTTASVLMKNLAITAPDSIDVSAYN